MCVKRMLITDVSLKLLHNRKASSSYTDGSIRQQIYNKYTYQNKKKMEKNYYHKLTLYIPVKCTMQQSVNGNIKHKSCDNKREGDFAGNKASTAVSTAIFLLCFSCTVNVGLCPSLQLDLQKCSSAPIGL